jgi:hypothetical protein
MIILVLTVLVWGGIALSEIREFSLKVRIELSGFDKSRFAVVQADSTLTLQVESSGYRALLYSLKDDPIVLKLDINSENVRRASCQGEYGNQLYRAVSVNDLGDKFSNELTERGMRQVGSAKDSLRLVLAERKSKVFRVDISDMNISFAEGYGLYGEPTVSPAEVTLYGDEETLARIEKVSVKKTALNKLMRSGRFYLDLDTSWRNDDVYASTDNVILTVPVEQYVEREYSLPIEIAGLDSTVKVNLYPDKITLRVWVPQRDIALVTAERFSVAVDYRDVASHVSKLKTHLLRFPQMVRVHSLSPAEVKYVVIK